jgi:DNA-binding beta-propeller fold protein YncE
LVPLRSIALDIADGVSTLAAHPDAGGTFLAAASRAYGQGALSTIVHIDVDRTLADDVDRVADSVVSADVGGIEAVNLVFAPDRGLAYATNRSPDGVLVIDARVSDVEEFDTEGRVQSVRRPRYRVLGAAAVPADPSGLVYLPRAGGGLVFTGGFADDVVWVLSALGDELSYAGRIDGVGAGPFGLAVSRRGERDLLLITTFFDHSLVVIDITGNDTSSFRRLARLHAAATPSAEESR